MEARETIIIGDIHGCIDELNDLLKTISYSPEKHRIILLGDLIDRGPDSLGVVQKARQMNFECVMGNHEQKFLKCYNKPDHKEYKDFYKDFTEIDIQYISQMPLYIQIGNTIAVHAGLKPGISISNQSKGDMLHLRYTDINRKFISLKTINEIGIEAAEAHFWTEFWNGPESVVYGHNVHSFEKPLIEEVSNGIFCYGLDTGCCFGGYLTALILEKKEIIQIKAKKTYYKSRFK